MENAKAIEPLLDAKSVKKLLRVSLPWVYKAVNQGLIPCIRIPCPGEGTRKPRALVRFKQKDIMDFIQNHYKK